MAHRHPYAAFDHLATMVAVVRPNGHCVFANASFGHVLGWSSRSVLRDSLFDWFVDAQIVRDTVAALVRNEFSSSRFEAAAAPAGVGSHGEPLPVHVIVNQIDGASDVLIELVEIEQQTRQDREERALGQAKRQQGTDPQPRPRDQEPARRNPWRGAAAGDGSRVARADRVHPGHHPGSRPAASAGGPAAGSAPQTACGQRREHPRGVRARAFADLGRISRAGCRSNATTTPRSPTSAATANN